MTEGLRVQVSPSAVELIIDMDSLKTSTNVSVRIF